MECDAPLRATAHLRPGTGLVHIVFEGRPTLHIDSHRRRYRPSSPFLSDWISSLVPWRLRLLPPSFSKSLMVCVSLHVGRWGRKGESGEKSSCDGHVCSPYVGPKSRFVGHVGCAAALVSATPLVVEAPAAVDRTQQVEESQVARGQAREGKVAAGQTPLATEIHPRHPTPAWSPGYSGKPAPLGSSAPPGRCPSSGG